MMALVDHILAQDDRRPLLVHGNLVSDGRMLALAYGSQVLDAH